MKLTFLGTGTSHGVPQIDCMLRGYERCPKDVCRAAQSDPRHCRTRSSALVEYDGKHVLIDISQDFRQQALRERIPGIDAVLVTHKHADHIGGLPDIRSYCRDADTPLDVYASAETIGHLRQSFSYAFDPNAFEGGGIPKLSTHVIDAPFELFGATITPVPVHHGNLQGCYGFRIGNLGYVPDMKSMPESSVALLKNLDLLVLNCLRDQREHGTHMILEQSMALAHRLQPKQCRFIHMCHDIHYQIDSRKLEPWMAFSYDGMVWGIG